MCYDGRKEGSRYTGGNIVEWLLIYLVVGFVLFSLGLARVDETVWIGFRAVPEVFLFQLLTFVIFWPLLIAVEMNRH